MSYIRQRTLGRYGKPTPPTTQAFTFPASVGGINAVDSLMQMPPTDCLYTYNMMPSEYGLRLRQGYRQWAIGCREDPQRAPDQGVKTIIPFESNIQDAANDRLFAVTSEGIWDVTLFNTKAPSQDVVFSQTEARSGYGVFCEFTGDAAGSGLRGHYLFYADGLNGLWQYEEGTDSWSQPPSGTLDTDLYYVDTDGTTRIPFPVDNVAFVMVHKQRIWVILEDEDDAWYFPTASVSGELKRFTFGSKMPHGGNLLGLYNWTLDGGDGVDDYMVAVSRGGDVMVYQGEDPEITPNGSNVGPWASRGAWFVGEMPESRRVVQEYGPDMYILSTYGVSSLQNLLNGVPYEQASPSKKINRFLREDVERGKDHNDWQITIHPAEGFLQVITPKPSQTDYIQYTLNIPTSGWGFWEGVPALCGASWNGSYFMGSTDGQVLINDGVLDGQELVRDNLWATATPQANPSEWTESPAGQYNCDGTQAAPTAWSVDLAQPTTVGETYIFEYTVTASSAGTHRMAVDGMFVTPEATGPGVFRATYTETSANSLVQLIGDADFVGSITDVQVRQQENQGQAIKFRTLTSFQAPAGHSNFNRVGFIRTIGALAGTAALNVKAVYDYKIEQTVNPPVSVGAPGQNVWDSAVWDQGLWDFSVQGQSFPYGALGLGRTFAVGLAGNATTRITIVGWDCLFQTGGYL